MGAQRHTAYVLGTDSILVTAMFSVRMGLLICLFCVLFLATVDGAKPKRKKVRFRFFRL